MLKNPDLKDEELVRSLLDAYRLTIEKKFFLSLDPDFNLIIYCIRSRTKMNYSLKLRNREFLKASISVPKSCADLGVKQVILPLPTEIGQNCSNQTDFKDPLCTHAEGSIYLNPKLETTVGMMPLPSGRAKGMPRAQSPAAGSIAGFIVGRENSTKINVGVLQPW